MLGKFTKVKMIFGNKNGEKYRYLVSFSTKGNFDSGKECVFILKNPSKTYHDKISSDNSEETSEFNYDSAEAHNFDITTQHVIKLFETDSSFANCDVLTILNILPMYNSNPNNITQDLNEDIGAIHTNIIDNCIKRASVIILAWGSFDNLNLTAKGIFMKAKERIMSSLMVCDNETLFYEVKPTACPIAKVSIRNSKPWHPQVWYFDELDDEVVSIKEASTILLED